MLLALGFTAVDLKQKHRMIGEVGYKQPNLVSALSIQIVYLEGKIELNFPSTPS